MMRLLGVFLVLCVLLCGCAQENTNDSTPFDESTQSATQPSEETAPTGIYEPESELEKTTGGAVHSFNVNSGAYDSFPIQDAATVVLRQEDGIGVLELYVGDTLVPENSATLGQGVFPAAAHFCVTEQGLAYYDAVDTAMVFLDHHLREIGRMQMPKEIIGVAWISPEWKTVYYCTDDGICALDLQTGISRLLIEQKVLSCEITGLLSNGTVLRCLVSLDNGRTQTIFVDASSGALLCEAAPSDGLDIWEDRYFLIQYENTIRQLRFGTEETGEVLWPLEDGVLLPMLQDNALIVKTVNDNALNLTYYRLDNGSRAAAVTLEGITEISNHYSDGKGGLWFLAHDKDNDVKLCHWDIAKSPTDDETDYSTPYFTAQEPDLEGLTQFENALESLEKRFSVDFLLWTDAVQMAPENQTFVGEHMVQVYERFLAQLEQTLAIFPDDFYKMATGEQQLQIALVRSISGDPEKGSLPNSTNLMFWKGDVPVIVLALGDDMERAFYHAAAHLIDTQVLSKSTAFYEWNTLNPDGFAYDNDYIINLDKTDTTYAEGDNRYFIDVYSMSYAREDRATIFEYGCIEGNEAYFRSTVIQEKLRRICKGIREAFDLEEIAEAFAWEQYLTT